MEPIGFEKRGERYEIIHRCVKCGFEKKNSFSKEDDFEVLLKLAKSKEIS